MLCWQKCKFVQPLCKATWSFLQKIKIQLLQDLASPLMGIFVYLKEMKSLSQSNTYTLTFIAALFTRAKIWKLPKYPSVKIGS